MVSDSTETASDAEMNLGAQARAGLREATEELVKLADYCDTSFKEGKLSNQNGFGPLKPECPIPGADSTSTVAQTADYAVRALQAVAVNVAVLAEEMEAKMSRLGEDIDATASEVEWIGMKIDMGRERAARREIRKLTIKKGEPQYLHPVTHNGSLECSTQPYFRRPIDYSCLDHVGKGGVKEPVASEHSSPGSARSMRTASISGARSSVAAGVGRPGTLRRGNSKGGLGGGFYADGGSALSLAGMTRVPTMPTVPTMVEEEKEAADNEEEETAMRSKPSGGLSPPPASSGGARRLSLLPPMPSLDGGLYDGEELEDDEKPEGASNYELPPPPPLPNYESHLSKISEGSDELDTMKDLADLLTQMDKIQSDLDYEMQS